LFCLIASQIALQVYRYRRVSTPVQRQQTKWVIFGFVLSFGSYGLNFALVYGLLFGFFHIRLSPLGNALSLLPSDLLLFLFPLFIGFAILRNRLWDIDILINRTLVYGTLTVSVIGLYMLVVVGLGSLVQAQDNHLLYGDRDEPARVLTRLGQRLEATLTPDAVLPAIVETVAQALKLPAVAITWTPGEGGAQPHTGASYGVVNEQTTQTRVPLVYQHETVGELVLAPRQLGESLTLADQRFLRELAPQIGVAVHAVRLTADLKQLTADLQHSRTELVTAREEERRRLRRDLHDGLGSVLASLNWRAGALRAQLLHDPVAADALVVEQQRTIQTALGDLRRLIYDLRPPALDELGLLGAIHEQAAKQQTAAERDRSVGLQVEVCAPDTLPAIPAAVEVAAYRIVQEALTNVARHAHAYRCSLRLSCTDEVLELEITDDGIGLPDEHHVGVGLLSMRERAGELGGRCEVKRLGEAGTQVRATLPWLTDEEQR
jgi:signal transduction histidine kinase